MSANDLGSDPAVQRRRTTRRRNAPLFAALTWLGAWCCALAPQTAHAHPYHVTFAEATLDEASWSLQIAIRMKPEDLEEALRRSSGVEAKLEEFPDRAAHAYRYLSSKLFFERGDAPRLPIRWVGMELSLRDAWVYLEVPLPSKTRRVTVHNDIFFDLELNQANTIELRLLSEQTTLTFRRDQPTAIVEIPVRVAR